MCVGKVLMWSTEISTSKFVLATSLITEFERLDWSVRVFPSAKVIILLECLDIFVHVAACVGENENQLAEGQLIFMLHSNGYNLIIPNFLLLLNHCLNVPSTWFFYTN